MAASEELGSGSRAKRIYRTVPEALGDDSEFQALSPGAKATWLMLRLKLGQYAINAFYVEILPRLVGLTQAEVNEALNELKTPTPARPEGWIAFEDNLFWIIDALVDDPGFSNANHREGARRFLANLPQLDLVERFRRYYGINGNEDVKLALAQGVDQPLRDAIGNGTPHPMGVRPQRLPTHTCNGRGSSESDPERGNDRETKSGNDTKPKSDLHERSANDMATPIDAERLPLAAIRFLERFYKGASNERRAEVVRQLLDTLYDERGAKISAGKFVKARGSQHLSKVCNSVASSPPIKADAAIVWVLRKLSDPEVDVRGRTVTEAKSIADRELDGELNAYRLDVGAKVDAWSQAHPVEVEAISARVSAETVAAVGEPGRDIEYRARLCQALRASARLPEFDEWAEERRGRIDGASA